jgi:hypothetical protein
MEEFFPDYVPTVELDNRNPKTPAGDEFFETTNPFQGEPTMNLPAKELKKCNDAAKAAEEAGQA